MTKFDCEAVMGKIDRLWPRAGWSSDIADELLIRLSRLDCSLEQAERALGEMAMNKKTKYPTVAEVWEALRKLQRDNGRPADRVDPPAPETPWRAIWLPRLAVQLNSTNPTDDELLEAWAKHRLNEASGLPDYRRSRVTRWVLRELARSWGTSPEARAYVAESLGLLPNDPELSRKYGKVPEQAPEQEVPIPW